MSDQFSDETPSGLTLVSDHLPGATNKSWHFGWSLTGFDCIVLHVSPYQTGVTFDASNLQPNKFREDSVKWKNNKAKWKGGDASLLNDIDL